MSRRDRTNIDAIAAGWVAREDRAPLAEQEQARLQAWLEEDRRHLGAYARARAVFVHFDRARALGVQSGPAAGGPAARRPRRKTMLWAAGMAACLCVVATLQLLGAGHHATATGEVLRVPLSDGSAVTLNSNSEIDVDFDDGIRRVRLLRGEALFDVAKDSSRPFVVDADSTRVTAVGTSFTVDRVSGREVKVLVREGVVELADSTLPRRQPVRLAANMLATAVPTRKIEVQPLRVPDVERRLAWRDGMLSFSGATLEEAAKQFARYSELRIIIDDPLVARKRVVGLYSATDPEGFAHAVALSLDLRAERGPEGIRLRRAPPQ